MEIIFSEEFRKDWKRIKDKKIRLKIVKAIKKLKRLPKAGKPLHYTFKGHRRLVIKPFRIIYRIEMDRIVINCFEHRNDVYRRQ